VAVRNSRVSRAAGQPNRDPLFYSKVCLDFTHGRGYFVVPSRRLGVGLLRFGSIYLIAMIIRYVLHMSLHPEERWLGGTIPIVFHWVLAAFLLMVGQYHWSHTRVRLKPKGSQT
jgi:hypothetical protein